MKLGVNIDHIATLRNARGGAEPNLIEAAKIALKQDILALTMHLREDRRHIKDNDLYEVKKLGAKINLEMAATKEIQQIALNLAFTGTIKDDILERVEIAYELLKVLHKDYKKNLQERYKISDEEMKEIETHTNYIYELMQVIGKKRGALVSGGNTDDEKVARIILDDFRNCKIGKISLEKP